MSINNYVARQDRAIDTRDADALDRSPFVTSLVKALVHTEQQDNGSGVTHRATGYVVGLTGEWGLGKSSILNLLSKELKQIDGVVVATLNPWLFKGRDELVNAYFNNLRDALGHSSNEKIGEIQKQLSRYKLAIEYAGKAIAGVIDAHGGGGVATTFFERWILRLVAALTNSKELSADKERKSLEKKLLESKIPVIVLIDELDRIEDDEVRAVAQLIKAVGDIKGISYIVAYDPARVTQALGKGSNKEERRINGESYLEKIIQFAIPIRPLMRDDSRKLIEFALAHNNIQLPSAEKSHQKEILNEITNSVRTPREIKRLIGAFSIFSEILQNEICPYDLLGYSWLVAKAPSVRDIIARNPDTVIDDPSNEELIARSHRRREKKEAEDISDILGAAAAEHARLLKLIFPRFTEKGREAEGNRIAKRRNLLRLLYLGNPPGMMHRAEIEKIWRINNINEMTKTIGQIQSQGLITSLLDRLTDLLPELPTAGDAFFWPALSKSLMRQHDWVTGEENLGSLVDDACTIIWQLSKSEKFGGDRLKNIVDALIKNDDLLMTPWILRKHLFAHSLTPYSKQNTGEEIYSKNETVKLRNSEIPRYRESVMDGTFLKRSTDTEAIYCIINSEKWDNELRSSLTAQLDSMNAIETFATIMVPPGTMTDLNNLSKLIDTNVILNRINSFVSESNLPSNDWIAICVKRFIATLNGKDMLTIDFQADNLTEDD